MGRGWSRETLANALLAGAVALALYAAAVALTGGFELRVAGTRLRSHAWIRPALAAVALMLGGGLIARARVAAASRLAWTLLDRQITARLIALAAAVWILAAGIRFGTFAAGGSDSYGYVSQAVLFAKGRLTDTVPLDPSYDWELAQRTLTPLGYTSGDDPGVIAPTYPPGFPLLLTAAWLISPSIVYFVVPLLGALAVWLSYRLGRLFDDPLAGGLAAALLSTSPAFMTQAMQPMSDVPAAAFWLAAGLFAAGRTPTRSVLGGAITSLAVLIRPNLAPLALVPLALAVWLQSERFNRFRHGTLFIAGAMPAAVALGWIQAVRYGSPVASGYGDVGYLFSLSNVPVNLERYATWLTETQTPFIWLCVLAPWTIAIADRRARGLLWSALVFSAGVLALYLPYASFARHEWTYLRFLLPALPFVLILATCAVLTLLRRTPIVVRAPLAIAIFGGILVFCAEVTAERHGFELRSQEQRYVEAGLFVRQRLPANAIVLASQHSGSVRLYGDRPILRFDLLQPADLDRALALLRASGRDPFMVIDPWERAVFYERFGTPYQKTLDTARLIRVVANVQIYAFD